MENLKKRFTGIDDPCKAVGCEGICCDSPFILMGDYERSRKFPKAVEVAMEVDFRNTDLPPGEYWKDTGFRDESGWEKLVEYKAVGMACPHKMQGGGCNIYSQRPEGCRGYKFGGPKCDETRLDAGLITINQILIAERREE